MWYGFHDFNQLVFVRGTQRFGSFLLEGFDQRIIDGFFVNGTGYLINTIARVTRKVQTGYLYHYAFAMVLGLCILLGWRLI